MTKEERFGETHPDLAETLVLANHILYAKGVVDGFGHVSIRHPDKPDCFVLSRSLAPDDVTTHDLQLIDFDGQVLSDSRKPYLERFIHAGVYRQRQDVHAVVHSHSESVIPFGVSVSERLLPVYHMASFLGEGLPVFEIRDYEGDASDMLVRNMKAGCGLAEVLGDCTGVLMRGHGATVVGENLRQAVFRAVYTEINARIQINAAALKPLTFLNVAEAHAASAVNDANIGKAWDLWVREVRDR